MKTDIVSVVLLFGVTLGINCGNDEVTSASALWANSTLTADARTNTTESYINQPGLSWVRGRFKMFLNGITCYLECWRRNSSSHCNCTPKHGCKTKKCENGDVCRMTFGRYPRCVRDRSVCHLPKATVACDATTPSYYYDKDTRICEEYTNGECSGNRNMFKTRGTCVSTCRRRSGFFFKRKAYNV